LALMFLYWMSEPELIATALQVLGGALTLPAGAARAGRATAKVERMEVVFILMVLLWKR